MTRHAILITVALALGLAVGAFAQVVLKFFAVLGLAAGPGPFQAELMQAADHPTVFWTVVGTTAAGLAAIFYLVWGVIRLVGRLRRKGRR